MISVYTLTLGRWFYLDKCLRASEGSLDATTNVEHSVYFQGVFPSEFQIKPEHGIFKYYYWDKNIGIANAMNKILPSLKGNTIIKMDEDCEIKSPFFYKHVTEIARLRPDLVFSPYPVGLIGNPGGVRGYKHEVIYSEITDTYYTLRYVNHVGGFCRVSPGFTKEWTFEPDLIEGISGNEDGQFSTRCLKERIPMAYLENAIIVEHQESTLGQHERYKEYFKGRF